MKNPKDTILTSSKSVAKAPMWACFVLALGSLTGCHNYTTAPMCSEENSVDPMEIPGFAGVYEFTIQDETFANTTEIIDLTGGPAAFEAMSDSATCLIAGNYYIQSSDQYEMGFWSYQRLEISGTGVSLFDVIFDRPSLDAAGVETWIFEVPQTLQRILGDQLSSRFASFLAKISIQHAQVFGLAIANEDVSAESVMTHAKPLPGGLTLFRR